MTNEEMVADALTIIEIDDVVDTSASAQTNSGFPLHLS